jgi:hypothetical protein
MKTYTRAPGERTKPTKTGQFVRAGEYREPRKGEWYLSGAIPQAYCASNDLSTSYYILREMAAGEHLTDTRHLLEAGGLRIEARTLIGNGLRIAAEKYKEDAATARADGYERLAEQFDRQERDSLTLAEAFEEADAVRIVP